MPLKIKEACSSAKRGKQDKIKPKAGLLRDKLMYEPFEPSELLRKGLLLRTSLSSLSLSHTHLAHSASPRSIPGVD